MLTAEHDCGRQQPTTGKMLQNAEYSTLGAFMYDMISIYEKYRHTVADRDICVCTTYDPVRTVTKTSFSYCSSQFGLYVALYSLLGV